MEGSCLKGYINDRLEPVLPVYLLGNDDRSLQVEAIIDTGCTTYLVLDHGVIQELGLSPIGTGQYLTADGSLAIGDIFQVDVVTEFGRATVEAYGGGTSTLIGMALLAGFSLRMNIFAGGEVVLEALEDI
jgi:predicted aspartyl protease